MEVSEHIIIIMAHEPVAGIIKICGTGNKCIIILFYKIQLGWYAQLDWLKSVFDESIKHADVISECAFVYIFHKSFYKRNLKRFSMLNNFIKTLGKLGEHSAAWFPCSTLVFSQLPGSFDEVTSIKHGKAFKFLKWEMAKYVLYSLCGAQGLKRVYNARRSVLINI